MRDRDQQNYPEQKSIVDIPPEPPKPPAVPALLPNSPPPLVLFVLPKPVLVAPKPVPNDGSCKLWIRAEAQSSAIQAGLMVDATEGVREA
jgi:hypothetical protein